MIRSKLLVKSYDLSCFVTGNSWGEDPHTGLGCVGCGAQENFRGCADIAIGQTQPNTPASSSAGPPSGHTPTTPSEPTPKPWPTMIEGVR